MTATFVRRLTGWTGDARLYRVEPPLEGYALVVVSATVVPFSGPETYIFGAKPDAETASDVVADWGELAGSYRGGLDHETALGNAGYSLVPGAGGL
jgi:hypothetical protein